ncbi:lysophospholipase L2 [Serratia odorifera]|uniref:Lysophospholipase L2 n=1 Tax=Serratia odorifera TaxID=618 RepID=A0A3S4HM46_SEROD|nr:lysophospholipase L2 [Serratia odorifera]
MTSFILSPDEWLTRETHFAAFATGPLLDFWRQRQEGEFSGVGGVPIRFVRFSSSRHQRVVVISPGRIESYVKYPEVAYDLFHCGYDVMILDHRGQGRSGRLLADPHRGHVVNFADYVEDFSRFYQQEVAPLGYRQRVALAHSMGGAILAQFLARQPQAFDAAALCAPMFGIILPMPGWMASRILNWAEKHPGIRDYYAVGTGQWRPLPYVVNMLTPQSRALSARGTLLCRLSRATVGWADLPLGAGKYTGRATGDCRRSADHHATLIIASQRGSGGRQPFPSGFLSGIVRRGAPLRGGETAGYQRRSP